MAVRYLAWSDLRHRWRPWLALVLLIGLAGTAVLGAAAGARRTATAYARLVKDTNAFDVLVNPDSGDTNFAAIEGLPQVEKAGRMTWALAASLNKDGEPNFGGDDYLFMVPNDGIVGRTVNRPKLVAGRLANPARVDEVVLSKAAAELQGLDVGDRLPIVVLNAKAAEAFENDGEPDPADIARVTLRVVGIGMYAQDVPVAASDRVPTAYLTPALWRRYRPAPFVTASMVKLRGGEASTPAFVRAAQRVDGEEQVFYQTQSSLRAKAARAARPYWGALAVFAIAAGAASIVIIGQALGRQLNAEQDEAGVTRALGMSRNQLFASAMIRVAAVVVVGVLLGVVGAALSSKLTPIGPARLAEPHPGITFDWTVLLGAAAALGLLLMASAVLPAWRAARAAENRTTNPSTVAAALTNAGLPPSATAGVRMALEPGGGRTSVPVRATIASAAIAVASLIAALTFAVSLNKLLDTPRLYGGDFDASVVVATDDDAADQVLLERVARDIEKAPNVAGSALGAHGQLSIGSTPVAAVALQAQGRPVFPTVVEGRVPTRDNEIVLGATSRARAGVDLGDTVRASAGDTSVTMRVVGEAVFPRFSAYPQADKTGLGEGAALTVAGLERLVGDSDLDFALVRFKPGVAAVAGRAALQKRLDRIVPNRGPFNRVIIARPEKPDDMLGYEDVSATPIALAALLAGVAGATTVHALISSVRRRRRDLALLKTIGFERRQIRATVAWQSTTVAVVALVIGLPLGVAVGRWGWTWLAERMHAVPEPVTPWLALLLALPLTLVLANAVAALPAGSAARTRPAAILRTE